MGQVLVAAWIGVTVGWIGFGWAMGGMAAGGEKTAFEGQNAVEMQVSSIAYSTEEHL